MSLASWVNKAWSGSDFWDKDENKRQKQQFAQQAQQQQQARQSQQPGQPQQVNQQQLPTAGAPRRTNVTDVISTLNTPKPQIAPPMQQAPPTLNQQVNKSYGSGISSIGNRLRDVVDPNTQADRLKRQATTGLDESFEQQQARKTRNANNSSDRLNTPLQVAKSIPAGVADFIGKTPGSIAQLQGRFAKTVNNIDNPILRTGVKLSTVPLGGLMTDKQADRQLRFGKSLNSAIDNKLQQSSFGDRKDDNPYITGTGKMFGQLGGQIATGGLGTYITGAQMAADEANKAEAKGKSNDYALGVGAIQGALGGLSEKYGVDKFIPGKGNVTGNLVTKMGKRFLTEGTQEAQQQFTQNLIANKLYDPNQGLKDGVVQSGLMGGLAGGVMSPIVDIPNRPNNPQAENGVQIPAPTKTGKPHKGEVAILSDYQESMLGKLPIALTNEVHGAARGIANRYGIDIISGSPVDINDRINNFIENGVPQIQAPKPNALQTVKDLWKNRTPMNQGGYVQIPFGRSEVNEGLSKPQIEFINDYAEMLQSMGEGNGVVINPETGTRITNNVRLGDTKGKNMSKYDWFNEAKRQLETGDSVMYGADKDYKNLPTTDGQMSKEEMASQDKLAQVQSQPTVTPQGAIPAPVKPDTAYGDTQRGIIAQEQEQGTRNSSPRSQSLKEPLRPLQQNEGLSVQPQGVGDTSTRNTSPTNQRSQRTTERINNQSKNTSNKTVPKTLNEFNKAIGGTGDIETQLKDNSATKSAMSPETKQLMDAINKDDIITAAAAEAQRTGKEINFYAEKDAGGRSVGIKRFDPRSNMIQAGFVTDKNGNTLGNHIKVDPTGLQVNVGGEMVNIGQMLGDVTKLGNNFKISSTMERNIRDNAPKEVADRLYKYTVANKIKNESNFKTELANERTALRERTKQTMKAKPRSVSNADYKADIFDYIEGNKSQTDLMGKYNTAELKTIDNYAKSTRNLYDSLLSRANTEFEKYGLPTVEPRKDYITHINELMNKKSFVGEVAGQLQGGIADEGKQTTRGAVPGNIAGRTEGFKPSKQWNRFFQERKGGEFSKDPFKAVDAYLEPTLHNIHMTESGVRARAVESALRTASELKEMNTTKVSSELSDSLAKFKAQGGNNELVRGFQEYANAITGKTQAFDRQIIDSGKGPALALKVWQKLQKIGGQATILGNVNSVLMQPLNQVGTLAQGGVKNYLKGTVASITNNKAIDSSPFITARQAKTDKVFKSKAQKVMDSGAVPLELLEMASVKNTWNVMHEQVKSEGIKGQDAIIETDRRTERLVAGRGIADRPELYRSTAANGLLQYTLEVNAQNKQFWHDLSPKQKATFMVATTGVNSILGAVTGNTPLPDFLKAIYDSVMDFVDDEEDDSAIANAGQAVQRIAGEAASMNPLVSAGANLLQKGVRQGMFGKESDLGRYDGTAAPVQVVKNAYDATSNLAKGEFNKAANSALRTVPFGNQARKTKAGYQLLQSGDVEVNPWNSVRALAFGPNAVRDKPDFGSSNRISGNSNSKGAVNASSVAGGRSSSDLGKAGELDSILKGQFNTKEGKKFLAMKEADKKAAAESDPEVKKMYDQYKTTKRINASNPDRPDGLSKESANILNWDKKRTVAQREKLQYSQDDYDFKLAKAKYEQEKLNGTISRAEDVKKSQSLKKAEVGSRFSKDTRESYNSLSKQQLFELASNDPNGKAIYEKALAYGDALVAAGLTKKNKLRTGGSGGKGKGGGGKKGSGAAGVSSILAMMKAGAAIKPPTPPKAPSIKVKKPTAVKLKKYAGAKGGKGKAPSISTKKGLHYT